MTIVTEGEALPPYSLPIFEYSASSHRWVYATVVTGLACRAKR
jgi:hypothetical protein